MSFKDYCTLSPDNIFGTYVGDICQKHDDGYSKQEFERSYYDWVFFQRLENRVGTFIAMFYYAGVRTFGWIYWILTKIKNNYGNKRKSVV